MAKIKWVVESDGARVLKMKGCTVTVVREAPGANGVSWWTKCRNGLFESGGADSIGEGQRLGVAEARDLSKRRR